MKTKRTKSIIGMMVGLGMMLIGPLIGFSGSMVGMNRAFSALGQSGTGDPNQLSHAIGATLSSNIAAIATSLVGLLVLAVCLFIYLFSGSRGEAPQ